MSRWKDPYRTRKQILPTGITCSGGMLGLEWVVLTKKEMQTLHQNMASMTKK
jgi:hypothetical protein